MTSSAIPPEAGELADLVERFLSHKRSLGYRYCVEAEQLARFVRFAQAYRIVDQVIPAALVDGWTARIPGERWSTQRIRVSTLQVFLQWVRVQGYQVTLPAPLQRQSSSYVPYIFTETEMQRFFQACDGLAVYPRTDKHLMLPVFFRVLYGCGLRVSEACHLRISDVDLEQGILTIHAGKGGKDWLVPVSPSLRDGLQRWAIHLRTRQADPVWFFETRNGQPPSRHWVYHQFRQCLHRAGIPHAGRGTGPRVHDIRHSFCVRSLKHLVDSGLDVYSALPILAAYVGHASPAATEGYVRLTVDLYPEILAAVTQATGSTIPEVHDDQTD